MKNLHSQQGAILVTSLLLLLVLTIIGVSVMQMTRMQERMAGNTRDMNLAFQGGEAALRAGEQQIMTYAVRPSMCNSPPCVHSFSRDVLEPLNAQTEEYWKGIGLKLTDEHLIDGLHDEPLYVSEELGTVCWTAELPCEGSRDFYQVSARSTGGSGDAEAIVQSTTARVSQ